jgi:hypothetical protein
MIFILVLHSISELSIMCEYFDEVLVENFSLF